jgi:hypothetical protein
MAGEQPSRGQEYAERPKEGEQWHEMILRQQREGNPESGYSRELLRSLPLEQQQNKDMERSDGTPVNPSLMAGMPSYEEMLRDASLRAMPEREQSMER